MKRPEMRALRSYLNSIMPGTNLGRKGSSNLLTGRKRPEHSCRMKGENNPMKRKEAKEKASFSKIGLNNPRTDKTSYHFIHTTGISEHCTKYELSKKYTGVSVNKLTKVIAGLFTQHKGWRVTMLSE
jgi:hypothetical protein